MSTESNIRKNISDLEIKKRSIVEHIKQTDNNIQEQTNFIRELLRNLKSNLEDCIIIIPEDIMSHDTDYLVGFGEDFKNIQKNIKISLKSSCLYLKKEKQI